MSELRQRPTATTSEPSRDTNTAPRQPRRTPEDRGISILDILRVLVTLIIASCSLSYYITNSESVLWGYRPWYTRWPVLKAYLVSSTEQDNSIRLHVNDHRSNPDVQHL